MAQFWVEINTQCLSKRGRFMLASNLRLKGVYQNGGDSQVTLATPQKVGRTTKMTVFPNCHRYLPYTYGYETT